MVLQPLAGQPESNVPSSQPLRPAGPQCIYLSLLTDLHDFPDVAMRCYTTRTLNANSFLCIPQPAYNTGTSTQRISGLCIIGYIGHLPSAKARQQCCYLCKPLITSFTAIWETVRKFYEQLLSLELIRMLRPMESHDPIVNY
jgi:hypothetical protein